MNKSIYTLHPWHGLTPGKIPEEVNAFIEMIPTDTIKYEVDKRSGYLKIDRPQKYSSVCPQMYGFIPQTLCAEKVGEFCAQKTGKTGITGDGDPIDICVFTSSTVSHGHIIIPAFVIGGMRMIDKNQADDKLIAVMIGDPVFGKFRDVDNCPNELIQKLKHYFLTYKAMPSDEKSTVEITHIYGSHEAKDVILASIEDYKNHYPD